MRQNLHNINGFNLSRNSLNSSFQGSNGAFNFINLPKLRESNQQIQNSQYFLNLNSQNSQFSTQNIQTSNIISCIHDGHEGNPLNLVCIDEKCLKKGVICTLCMHFEHQKHETVPLQIFLSQFKEQLRLLILQNQVDENGNNQIDIMLEQVMQVQNDIIESLKIFSQKTYEAIQKTKDYLYQIFLQEIHGYQTFDMKVADLTETIKMYENNNIKNANHHTELIYKMVQKIISVQNTDDINYKNQFNFKLQLFPQQYGIHLQEMQNQIITVQENIENEIQEMHHQIQQSLQNILDYSTLPKQNMQSFTLNSSNNQPLSAHFAMQQEETFNNNSKEQNVNLNLQNKQQSSSSSRQLQPTQQVAYNRSVSQGLPPPSHSSSSKQQTKSQSNRISQQLNSSFQSETTYKNLAEYQPNIMNTQQSRRKETHLLSRSYASSSSPKEHSPYKSDSRQNTSHSLQNKQGQNEQSNQNLKGTVSYTPNFSVDTDNFSINPISNILAHNNVIRDMVSVGNNKIATCSYDSIIKIWKKNNSSLIQELKGHTDEVYQLSYSNKHNLLASSSYDKTIRIWKEYSEWKQLVTLRGHTGKTWAVKFIDVTNKLATGGNDRIIRIWNIFNGECESLLEGSQDTIWSLHVLNDGIRLVSGDNKYIKFWDHKAGKVLKSLQAHEDRIYQLKELCWQKNSKQSFLISSGMDKKVKVWNIKNYALLYSFAEQMIVTSIETIIDRNIIVLGLWGDKKEGGIAFWYVPLEQSVKENQNYGQQPLKIKDYMGTYSGVSQLIYDSDLQNLYTSHSNGQIQILGLKWR
ncbi:WD domain, G-beta repeat protein (macronuclear) [Tetrahymena thermophila SB210]|uniref:WD domain, G-beta repeat protein n=1 Tax=Tetrahymena thermophila (strain SB210) TaxID=312017 RepID=I7LXJ9_TETTS|nr:WD domain, G-beta repeat protein [Tetrahymena thermophila SB210]EAS04788.1 WD domain, G-beta repeat protein [Tetrahymena thermophila SB210]|eukprot:XP_001025033.1 WD domain, G-beta repeat protein [Tetrahymena thermophila SB210]